MAKRRPQGDGTIASVVMAVEPDVVGHKNDGCPWQVGIRKNAESALKQLHQLIDLYRDVDSPRTHA